MRRTGAATVLGLAMTCALLVACRAGVGTSGGTTEGNSGGLSSSSASTAVPRPSHVVIVIEENHSSESIVGSPTAPYINSLAGQGALFTDSTAITHPSEPNYLALFSGSTQGLKDDSCPHTYTTDSLGTQLAAAGQSFVGYSEGLPAPGDLTCTAGDYARKHSPWTNYPAVPASGNQPFSAFPQNYDALPAVSIVVPNLADDMHNGTVAAGDAWLRRNLDGYAQWARTHNSLLIVTWDEDDNHSGNRITTIFEGAQVKPGSYSEPINHYRVLRTVEEAFGLAPLGHAADAPPITDVWATGSGPAATGP